MRKTIGFLLLVLSVLLLSYALSYAQSRTRDFELNWIDNADDETGQGAERAINGGPYSTLILGIGANISTFTDHYTGNVGDKVCYRVFAFNAVGNSPFSNEACLSIAATLPKAPANLTAKDITANKVSLNWRIEDTEMLASGQKVYREVISGAGQPATISLNTFSTIHTDTNLRKNTGYRYRVCAWNLSGEQCSNLVSIRTPNR